ncbi:SAM-dependent methyltransferase [Sphaerisporangium sp. NPDC005288]|uniref:class I SAM-dependent methyltransferase n=1 Tax=Sphaerisporangium sp. NPDC005288 TaxID=3155114 RepID=UPI0033BDD64A
MNENGEPSRTALMAAAARAAHLIVDDPPLIFADTLAHALLADRAEELLAYHRLHGAHLILSGVRAAAVTRARHTEDRLADAVRRGVAQYVILGAGLDSYAYRAGAGAPVQVYEVDHPATQAWKRTALAGAGIAVADTVTFVPVDFENDALLDGLTHAGFDPSRPAFVSWLGVTMYLTREGIGRTLEVIGGFAPGSQVVVDHMLPEELRDEAGQAYVEGVMPMAAEQGEPWLSILGPEEMAALLAEHGLTAVEHAGQRESVDAALWTRTDSLRPSALSMLTRAVVRS